MDIFLVIETSKVPDFLKDLYTSPKVPQALSHQEFLLENVAVTMSPLRLAGSPGKFMVTLSKKNEERHDTFWSFTFSRKGMDKWKKCITPEPNWDQHR